MDDVIDDARWTAVEARDVDADGAFVYGVRTTGVYCRPTCPSRRPKRVNVQFFSSPSEARSAGLRPCRRCDPDGPTGARRRAELVASACRLIEGAVEPPDLAELAGALGVSPHHFHRVFKATTGVTPKAYAEAQRAARVRDALGRERPIIDAIYDAGFGSNGRFYASSTARLGMRPTDFRAGGPDMVVRFAVGECTLGSVLVAATELGVCAIDLGDDPDLLVSSLQERFHQAELVGDDPAFAALVAAVVGTVDEPRIGVELPLDIRGTAFQQRVWQELRCIPAGTTTTYFDLAARIGRPTSVRAVAQACGANRLAVAIPCHRVIRRSGELAGYRWGVERKRALLDREASGLVVEAGLPSTTT